MIGSKIITLIVFISILAIQQGHSTKTINVTTPGTLSSLLSDSELNTEIEIIVFGTIDARDFTTMRDKMPVLEKVDLSAASITAYTGTGGTLGTGSASIVIYPANEIPYSAFPNKQTLKSIKMPTSTLTIGSSAFSGCTSLTGPLNFPPSLSKIGNDAFMECSGLTGTLIFPITLSTIGDFAFSICTGLTGTLSFPSSINQIGAGAFKGCSGFTGSLIVPSLTDINASAFENCTGFKGTLTIPTSVKIIGENAFTNGGFTGELIIPTSVTTISANAFALCQGFSGNLNLPSSVTSIGHSAFYYCRGLNGTLTLPSTIQTIAYSVFESCIGLTGSLTIPSSVTSIESFAFNNCSSFDGTLLLPPTLTNIGISAFAECKKLTGSLVIPSSMKSISVGAFRGCKSLTGNLVLPTSITAIESSAFAGCTGISGKLKLPLGVTAIGENAFKDCSSLSGGLTIPPLVKSIKASTFEGCFGLNDTISIHLSVTAIENAAFKNCVNIKAVNSYVVDPVKITLGTAVFGNIPPSSCTLNVPLGKKALYGAAAQWKDFSTTKEGIPALVTTQPVTNTSSATPTGNGYMTHLDVSNQTHYGIVWSTAPNPTVNLTSKTDKGIATASGPFSTLISGLEPNTIYYAKAYATNSMGTTYGEEVTFRSANPTVASPSSDSLIGFTTPRGTASHAQTFSISGNDLVANLVVQAPIGFEVRELGIGLYGSSVSFAPVLGIVTSKTIEVRISAVAKGGFMKGNVECTSYWALKQTIEVEGIATTIQLSVTTPQITLTKTYDGNKNAIVTAGNISGVLPTDISKINWIAAAAFEDANTGTGKTIIVSYLLGGSAAIKYDAPTNDTVYSGTISAKQLTISSPTIVKNKMVDGNTNASITTIPNLQGCITNDVENVSVTAAANYDNADVGTNKSITVVFTLNGSASGNYAAPENYSINDAKISDYITLSPLNALAPSCEGTSMVLPFKTLTGTPTHYKIEFDGEALSAGMQSISYTEITTIAADGFITFKIPDKMHDGDYHAVLKMKNELNVESQDYAFEFIINVSSDYFVIKFNDVILFDNSENRFKSYQWYKNGIEIVGATKQFYCDPIALVGSYSLKLTTIDGRIQYSCPIDLDIPLKAEIIISPNPVPSSSKCTVTVSGINENELQQANLTIYDLQGFCVYNTRLEGKKTELILPKMNGLYVGHVTTNDKDYLFKISARK